MTDNKFNSLSELTYVGTCNIQTPTGFHEVDCCYIASNDNALSMSQDLVVGETVYVERIISRDLKFHKAYMGFLSYVWDYLPNNFQRNVAKKFFYKWLKQYNGDYDIIYKFKHQQQAAKIFALLAARKKQEKWKITYKQLSSICAEFAKSELIEYKSISFARMDEIEFREYIKNQLPKIYEIIRSLHSEEMAIDIIETIEKDWEKFFDKLNK